MDKKYLNKRGLSRLIELMKFGKRQIWHGTQEEWDALTAEEKDKYDQAEIIDTNGITAVDKVEEGNMNPVTSNAVAEHQPYTFAKLFKSALASTTVSETGQIVLKWNTTGAVRGVNAANQDIADNMYIGDDGALYIPPKSICRVEVSVHDTAAIGIHSQIHVGSRVTRDGIIYSILHPGTMQMRSVFSFTFSNPQDVPQAIDMQYSKLHTNEGTTGVPTYYGNTGTNYNYVSCVYLGQCVS